MNPAPPPILSLVPIAAIFLIFYFLLIRPQQKQAKEHEKMLQEIKARFLGGEPFGYVYQVHGILQLIGKS